MAERIALVTGANQGVGFQVSKELVAHGVTVLLGARDLARGEAAASEIGPGATAIQIDVTDLGSIAAAAGRIMPGAGAAAMHDLLAHLLQHGLCRRERALLAAAHEGERRALGPPRAAGHRRVDR